MQEVLASWMTSSSNAPQDALAAATDKAVGRPEGGLTLTEPPPAKRASILAFFLCQVGVIEVILPYYANAGSSAL